MIPYPRTTRSLSYVMTRYHYMGDRVIYNNATDRAVFFQRTTYVCVKRSIRATNSTKSMDMFVQEDIVVCSIVTIRNEIKVCF